MNSELMDFSTSDSRWRENLEFDMANSKGRYQQWLLSVIKVIKVTLRFAEISKNQEKSRSQIWQSGMTLGFQKVLLRKEFLTKADICQEMKQVYGVE